MINDMDIVKIKLEKRDKKNEFFTFKVRAFDVGDFFEKFLKYFDNYDDVTISFGKYFVSNKSKDVISIDDDID